tara:strand:+ start:2401 stop:2553 length:153 start_codon:yes stop_codon:yes gene_type:complete
MNKGLFTAKGISWSEIETSLNHYLFEESSIGISAYTVTIMKRSGFFIGFC